MATVVNGVVTECKKNLKGHYGNKFAGLILYGSMARGDADESSDIDLLVLLEKPFYHFRELRTIIDLIYPLELESDYLISAKPAAADEYETGSINLYRNARREGVSV